MSKLKPGHWRLQNRRIQAYIDIMIRRSRQGFVSTISLMMLCSWLSLPVVAAAPGSMPPDDSMPCDGADPLEHDHGRDCDRACSSSPDQDQHLGPLANAHRDPSPGKFVGSVAQPDLLPRRIARTLDALPRAPPLIPTATPVARHDILLD